MSLNDDCLIDSLNRGITELATARTHTVACGGRDQVFRYALQAFEHSLQLSMQFLHSA